MSNSDTEESDSEASVIWRAKQIKNNQLAHDSVKIIKDANGDLLFNEMKFKIASKTLRFTFYGVLTMYKDIFVYMAVTENQSNVSLLFGLVYDVLGINMVFLECTTDKIDSDFDCHFIRQSWIIGCEFSYSNFEEVVVYSKEEIISSFKPSSNSRI